jgi:hypothetical protein
MTMYRINDSSDDFIALRETIRPPVFKDPNIKVRILKGIYVGGVALAVGTTATLATSDAQLLAAAIPPSVEIL